MKMLQLELASLGSPSSASPLPCVGSLDPLGERGDTDGQAKKGRKRIRVEDTAWAKAWQRACCRLLGNGFLGTAGEYGVCCPDFGSKGFGP